jgi:hypothetical protein
MNDKYNHLKDDYLDSLSFNTLLPEVKTKPNLYKLLNSFNFPVIRVTARTINGLLVYPTEGTDGGFHIDDCPFEVLRINVSLSNNGNFGLEYKNKKVIYSDRDASISETLTNECPSLLLRLTNESICHMLGTCMNTESRDHPYMSKSHGSTGSGANEIILTDGVRSHNQRTRHSEPTSIRSL